MTFQIWTGEIMLWWTLALKSNRDMNTLNDQIESIEGNLTELTRLRDQAHQNWKRFAQANLTTQYLRRN